jgi:hypothetical protein
MSCPHTLFSRFQYAGVTEIRVSDYIAMPAGSKPKGEMWVSYFSHAILSNRVAVCVCGWVGMERERDSSGNVRYVTKV